MTDHEIKAKVNQVLKLMEEQFHKAEPSLAKAMSRRAYFDKLEKEGHGLTQQQKLDFQFALTAKDIIDNNVPWLAAGCTGCSRLFSYYARSKEVGLNDFNVVLTVKTDQIGKEGNGQLSGHQAIAIKLSDGLHIIDVERGLGKTFEEIEVQSECRVNNIVDFEEHKGYTIATILTPEQYNDEITNYQNIKEKYLSCSTAKTIKFRQSMEHLDYVNQNRVLTENNYNKSGAIQLGNRIMNVLQPLINDNRNILQHWYETDYEQKKLFIKDTLKILLQQFPSSTIKPKILFKDDIGNVDIQKHFNSFSAAFFAKETSPWAADNVKKLLGNDEPLFIFMDDLKDRPLGQIAHEFTHYLQATKQSTISPEVLKKSIEYYPYIKNNRQTHNENIQEVEAIDIGDYVRQQTRQILELSIQHNIITQDER